MNQAIHGKFQTGSDAALSDRQVVFIRNNYVAWRCTLIPVSLYLSFL